MGETALPFLFPVYQRKTKIFISFAQIFDKFFGNIIFSLYICTRN